MGCDPKLQVKIQGPIGTFVMLLAAIYFVAGTNRVEICFDFGSLFSSGVGSPSSSGFGSSSSGFTTTSGSGFGSSSSGFTTSSSSTSSGSSVCLQNGDGDCDDGGPGSEFSICSFGTDTIDCPRTGRRLQDMALVQQTHHGIRPLVDEALKKYQRQKEQQPTRRRLQQICQETDADMIDLTFGRDGVDGSPAVGIAFACSIICFLLALVGTILGFCGKMSGAMCCFGVALIFNCLYWIYLIPYDAEVDNSPAKPRIKPSFGWGAGCNCGAFINLVLSLIFAKLASKTQTPDPKPNAGVTMSTATPPV